MKKRKSTKTSKTGAGNLEERFDGDKNVLDYFDTGKAAAIRRITLDVPEWALKALEGEANRRGIARQALIKTWLIDRLDAIREKKTA